MYIKVHEKGDSLYTAAYVVGGVAVVIMAAVMAGIVYNELNPDDDS